jgi:hypothetical protein
MLAALLWGSLTIVGAVVVPMLFVLLSPKALAGRVAGELFVMESTLVLALSAYALVRSVAKAKMLTPNKGLSMRKLLWAPAFNVLLATSMLSVVIENITHSEPQDRVFWHTLGSLIYALMWVLSAKQLTRFAGSKD